MSLNKASLKTAIKTIVLTGFTDVSSAASAWTSVYNDYANGSSSFAQDQSTDRVLTVNVSALQSGLVSAFTSGSASGAASGIESAVQAYWTGAIFGITTPPTLLDPLAVLDVSAVVSNPGTGLASALSVIFSSISDDADAKADAIATAFDTHAKTVQVFCNYIKTNVAPPPPLLPATLTLSVS